MRGVEASVIVSVAGKPEYSRKGGGKTVGNRGDELNPLN
jgi:hypothetical protein